MSKRPSIPRRLTGAHPRSANGRFISQRTARRHITRLRAAQTRHDRVTASRHGEKARKATERRQTPQQKAAQTRKANQLQKAIEQRAKEEQAHRDRHIDIRRQSLDRSLDEILDDYGEDFEGEDFEIEGNADYATENTR